MAPVSGGWWCQDTTLGPAFVLTIAPGVVARLGLGGVPPEEWTAVAPRRDERVAREVDEYLTGTRRRFTVRFALDAVAAPFRRRVLEAVARDVPFGETATYGEVAELVGHPGAARAVGTALAHNPVQLLVPCHRVVAAQGIGGYGGGREGIALKRALLDLERRRPTRSRRVGRSSRRSG